MFLRPPRVSVGVILSILTVVSVSVGVLPFVGNAGWRGLGVAIGAGAIAGVVAATVCVVVWRAIDVPRRDKLPFPDILYAEGYMWSLDAARERARAAGLSVEAAEEHMAASTSPGERARVLPVMRDRVRRQSVGLALVTVLEALLLPSLFLGLFGDVRLWAFLAFFGSVVANGFLLSAQVEGIGRWAQMRDRLERVAGGPG
jgi:hypothetical protein